MTTSSMDTAAHDDYAAFEVDRHGRIVGAGRAWSALTGLDADALRGRSVRSVLDAGLHQGLSLIHI